MCKDNIFPEKNNGFQALPGADFLPWPYSAAEKNDYFCDHKIESTMIRQYAGLVKFAHTIFAMPFASSASSMPCRTEGIPSDCAADTAGWCCSCRCCSAWSSPATPRWASTAGPTAASIGPIPARADREFRPEDQCPGSAPFRDRQCAAVRCHRLDYQFTYRIIIACGTIRYIDI